MIQYKQVTKVSCQMLLRKFTVAVEAPVAVSSAAEAHCASSLSGASSIENDKRTSAPHPIGGHGFFFFFLPLAAFFSLS